jgi:hypothetical protein
MADSPNWGAGSNLLGTSKTVFQDPCFQGFFHVIPYQSGLQVMSKGYKRV